MLPSYSPYIGRITMALLLYSLYYILIISVLVLASNASRLLQDKVFSAHIKCGKTIDEPALVYVISDIKLSVTVICDGNHTYDAPQRNEREYYNKTIYYSGNPTSDCVFTKKVDPEIYQVVLEIVYYFNLEHILETYVLSCTNDPHKAGVQSSVQELSHSLIPRKQFETHLGHSASSIFSLQVQDIYGNTLSNKIGLRKKIRLAVTMSGTATEKGFKVVHCYALGAGSNKYSFLRSGCGDGYVLPYEKGFTTGGLTAFSPYFWSFRLYGSNSVSFQCTFNTCVKSCDGDSCERKRLKREEVVENDIDSGDQTIMSSLFSVIRPNFNNKNLHLVESDFITIDGEKKSDESIPESENLHEQTVGNSLISDQTKTHQNKTTISQIENILPRLSNSDESAITVETSTSSSNVLEHPKTRLKIESFGMTYDQIGVIVGCSSFLLMVCLFLCILMWQIRQKNMIVTKYRTLRVNNLGSTTYLLDDMDE